MLDVPSRFVYLRFQIDTNRINSRNALPAMNRIERWHRDGVIELLSSETATTEMMQGGDSARRAKAAGMIFSYSAVTTSSEQWELEQLAELLFPGGAKTQSERNDVEIVFNAEKYRAILITNDGGSKRQPGGILGHRDELMRLGIQVMRDVEAVELIEARIRDRDEQVRMYCAHTGSAPPEWFGRD